MNVDLSKAETSEAVRRFQLGPGRLDRWAITLIKRNSSQAIIRGGNSRPGGESAF